MQTHTKCKNANENLKNQTSTKNAHRLKKTLHNGNKNKSISKDTKENTKSNGNNTQREHTKDEKQKNELISHSIVNITVFQ